MIAIINQMTIIIGFKIVIFKLPIADLSFKITVIKPKITDFKLKIIAFEA